MQNPGTGFEFKVWDVGEGVCRAVLCTPVITRKVQAEHALNALADFWCRKFRLKQEPSQRFFNPLPEMFLYRPGIRAGKEHVGWLLPKVFGAVNTTSLFTYHILYRDEYERRMEALERACLYLELPGPLPYQIQIYSELHRVDTLRADLHAVAAKAGATFVENQAACTPEKYLDATGFMPAGHCAPECFPQLKLDPRWRLPAALLFQVEDWKQSQDEHAPPPKKKGPRRFWRRRKKIGG